MKFKKTAQYRLFGIPNCDTVKKVRIYLEENKVDYQFVDFKKQPPLETDIIRWKAFMKTWPANTKGPTYRKIRDQFEAASESKKIEMLIENPSAVKRPILEEDGVVKVVGFDQEFYR